MFKVGDGRGQKWMWPSERKLKHYLKSCVMTLSSDITREKSILASPATTLAIDPLKMVYNCLH